MARIITDFLDRAAERLPDKTAFLDPSGSVTFAQLRARARAIAQGLIDKRIFKKPVAIYLDKGIPCIAAMMGAAYSGNYYTVIDTQMPAARISRIMTTLQPAAVICPSQAAEQAGAFAGEAAVLDYDKLEQTAADDAAIEAADVVLMDDDPLKIPKAINISKKCLRIAYENIVFAIGVKLLCLILGAFGIANMGLAIFADVGVMVLAVLNAIRALHT